MVRVKAITLAILICFITIAPASTNIAATKYAYIRLHILANSDAPEDQAVKLKVRDAILKGYSMELKNVGNKNDSKEILTSHLTDIEETARRTLAQYGFSNEVTAEYSQEQFPKKTYGKIVYPPGEYTALRVIIGKGQGHNWWCVMFPPLCIGADAMTEEDETEDVVYDFKIRELLQDVKKEMKSVFS